MKTPTENLISDLIERTRKNLNQAQQLHEMDPEVLNFKSSPQSWSALECLEHLNYYGDYYLPEIEDSHQELPHYTRPCVQSRNARELLC